MPKFIRSRLSVMMFFHYFAPGALYPVLPWYLLEVLGYTSSERGQILAMQGLAALISPFIVTRIADYRISAERLLAVLHLSAGLLMVVALGHVTDLRTFQLLYLVYSLLFMPTFALTNTVAFHHIDDIRRDFGAVRVWGSLGWFAVAWVFGYFWIGAGKGETDLHRVGHVFLVSGGCSIGLGLYMFTLPRRAPRTDVAKEPFPLRRSLATLMQPGMRVLCLVALFTTIVNQFFYFGMAPFLRQEGFAANWVMPVMSLGQVCEVFTMYALGACLMRFSIKWVLLLGIAGLLVRYVLFAAAGPDAYIYIGVLLHGVSFSFFFTAVLIYVDAHSPRDVRAGTQQLFNVLIAGVGPLVGPYLAGRIAQNLEYGSEGAIRFGLFWMVPALWAGVTCVILMVGFREMEKKERTEPQIGAD